MKLTVSVLYSASGTPELSLNYTKSFSLCSTGSDSELNLATFI